jgi:putative endonuclease
LKNHNYYIYITTNPAKTVLYTGVTNNIARRMQEHYENRGKKETFAGKFYCYNLIYWERFSHINDAISREKEIKAGQKLRKLNS